MFSVDSLQYSRFYWDSLAYVNYKIVYVLSALMPIFMKNYLLFNKLIGDRGNSVFRSLYFLRLSKRLVISCAMGSSSVPENWFEPH